jgi:hypothetical protein
MEVDNDDSSDSSDDSEEESEEEPAKTPQKKVSILMLSNCVISILI